MATRVAFRAGTLAAAATITASVALVGATPASAMPAGALYWTFLSNGASGKCLEIPGNNGSDGAPVQQWTCNRGENQKWYVYATGDGYYTLVNSMSGDCLDVPYASKDRGTALQQWSCNGGDNQKWVISGTDPSTGLLTITNKNSWMVIDNPNGSTSDGARMVQWPYNYGKNQFWHSFS
ncbi:RICIN domain-containing protein [Streptomyces sp. NPDC050485]|uniref:RICIN domain-containing protein n=1 Tax=Streptomyces sp. NPDC050485 TaxID=3365617 RepID=UPI0037913D76